MKTAFELDVKGFFFFLLGELFFIVLACQFFFNYCFKYLKTKVGIE